MFRRPSCLSRLPEDGSAVIIGGYVSFTQKTGSISSTREPRSSPAGSSLRFERTKKLEERGWLTCPSKTPSKIPGRWWSPATGAVLHDILNVAKRRFPGRHLLAPAAVQGSGRPQNSPRRLLL